MGFIIFCLLASALLLSACGDAVGPMGRGGMMGGSGAAGSITVQLLDWSVLPSQSTAHSGRITFHAVHPMIDMMRSGQGGATHDLQVMRKNPDGTFEMVGQVQGLRIGEAKDLTVDLSPGDYELECNVVEDVNGTMVAHYKKGMHFPFTVTS